MTTWSPEDLLGLSRPSPLAVDWPAPVDVRLEGDSVTWDRAATQSRNGRQEVGPDLLEHFGALDRTEDLGAAVVAFVRSFGPLGVTEDGKPLSALEGRENRERGMRVQSLARHAEPLSAYRYWSARVAAVLPVVGALTTRRKVAIPDLVHFARVVYDWTEGVDYRQTSAVDEPLTLEAIPYDTDTDIEARLKGTDLRGQVSGLVTGWLYAARVGVGVQWPERKPFGELSMVGGSAGCLASILLQLALTMTRAESAYTCAGCGLPFSPRRIPREGQRAFCDVCRTNGIPQKLATRDMRRRQAKERRSNV